MIPIREDGGGYQLEFSNISPSKHVRTQAAKKNTKRVKARRTK
jgi:hypothetical protein